MLKSIFCLIPLLCSVLKGQMDFPKWADSGFRDSWSELDSMIMKEHKLVDNESCKLRVSLYNRLSTNTEPDAQRSAVIK